MASIDGCYERLAAKQYGVVTRQQLLAVGLSRRQIENRIAERRLVILLPATYALPSFPRSWEQRLFAALLWAGADAAVSHRSAACLWRFPGFVSFDRLEVMTARSVRAPGVQVRRAPKSRVHVVQLGKFRVTSAHRTLLELGAYSEEEAVEIALDDALRRGITSYAKLERCIRELGGRGRRGSAVLRKLLEERDPRNAPTESPLETKALRFFRKARLPTPVTQFPLYKDDSFLGRVDLAYPQARLAIEVESYAFHSGRPALERDALRANDVVDAGWRLMRLTSDMLEKEPQRTEAQLRKALRDAELVLFPADPRWMWS